MGCGHSSNKQGVHDHTINLDIDGDDSSLGGSVQLHEAQRHSGSSGYDGAGELVLSSSERHGSGRAARGSGAAAADTVPVRVGANPDLADSAAAHGGKGKGMRARKAVFVRPFNNKDRGAAPTRSKTPKTDDQLTCIMRALSKCYLFSDMSEPDRDELVAYMWREKVKVGASVLTQNRKSDNFYVIESGTFEFSGGSLHAGVGAAPPGGSAAAAAGAAAAAAADAGSSLSAAAAAAAVRSGSGPEPFFGENALLFQTRSSSTVRCSSSLNEDGSGCADGSSDSGKNGTVWVLDRATYRSVFTSRQQAHRQDFRAAVDAIPLLSQHLTPEQRDKVVSAMEVVVVKANQRVVRKGDHGDVCYFIKEGTVECSNIGEAGLGKIELEPGSYFGERALLTDEPRAADVTTLTDTVLLALDRRAFNEHLGPLRALMDENMKGRVVEAVPILQQLPRGLRSKIIAKFEIVGFRDREVIVHEGDIGDRFFIVRAGTVEVLSEALREGSGDSAHGGGGGSAQTGSSASGSASTSSGEGAVGGGTGGGGAAAAAAGAASSAATRLRRLAGKKTTSSATATMSSAAGAGKQSTTDMYGARLATLGEGDWFGEMALLNNEPRTATCVAVGAVECFALSFESFKLMRGKSDLLSTTSQRRTLENRQKRDSAAQANVAALTLKDVHKRKILGKGTFGTVYLAEAASRSPVQGVWALKMMNKAHIVECDQTRNVVNERDILLELRHPFVLRLFATFQDKSSLYMLFEFVQGGELFSIMQEHFRLPLAHAQFYAACIVDAFEYMHALDVVYRDLKPENILIDAQGYAKIADFGFAKRVHGGKTYTLCGTPEYLAPEVVLGKGHDKGVDYWGVGILMYEILAGISPFADEYSDDQIVVCKNVVNGKVDWNRLEAAIRETEMSPPATLSEAQIGYVFSVKGRPPKERKGSAHALLAPGRRTSLNSRPVESLIRKLLAPASHQRLGCLRDGAQDIKRHAFFGADADAWAALRAKQFPAPFVPVLTSATDTSNFDDFEPDTKWDAYTGPNDWCRDY